MNFQSKSDFIDFLLTNRIDRSFTKIGFHRFFNENFKFYRFFHQNQISYIYIFFFIKIEFLGFLPKLDFIDFYIKI